MNDNDYKKIADLVDERVNRALEPIKKDLTGLKQDLKEVKDIQKQHTEILGQHTEILEKRVLPSVTYIEKNIKAYKDAYQINNANGKKLEKRVEVLENHTGITAPLELTLSEVA